MVVNVNVLALQLVLRRFAEPVPVIIKLLLAQPQSYLHAVIGIEQRGDR